MANPIFDFLSLAWWAVRHWASEAEGEGCEALSSLLVLTFPRTSPRASHGFTCSTKPKDFRRHHMH